MLRTNCIMLLPRRSTLCPLLFLRHCCIQLLYIDWNSITISCPLFTPTEGHRSLQAKERGTVWPAEPQVDQMAAETLLSVLFRPGLPGSESGLSVRGRRQFSGSETRTQHCATHQGMRTTHTHTHTLLHLHWNQNQGEWGREKVTRSSWWFSACLSTSFVSCCWQTSQPHG